MRLAMVTMCKDEADTTEAFLRHSATQVDHIYVADNLSTDGTREILERLGGELPMTLLDDPEVGYNQAAKMTRLADRARSDGFTWVLPADFDEVWYSAFGTIKAVVKRFDLDRYDVLSAELYDHVSTSEDPQEEPNPFKRIGWRRDRRNELPKVCCRLKPGLRIWQGNHNCDYTGQPRRVMPWALTVRHFPYRSEEQWLLKIANGAAAYAATDLPEDMGQHWRAYGRLLAESGEKAALAHYDDWFFSHNPPALPAGAAAGEEEGCLLYDPAPLNA